MANTLLYPMTVSAKVMTAALKVPSLTGEPLNRDALLEDGIHLHWALPDALTASKVISGQGTRSVIFPAVPDQWLVLRFNPGASSATPFAQRTWKAWVVDSISQTVTPLPTWTPPTDRDPGRVHTLAGMLPNASSIGQPGFGLWDTDRTAAGNPQTFDPAMAAYYPESRGRFGFLDARSELPRTGNVSYLVIGWYWTDHHDPLAVSAFPGKVLDRWKAVAHGSPAALRDIATTVALPHAFNERDRQLPGHPGDLPQVAARPVWDAGITVAGAHPPPPARVDQLKRNAQRVGSFDLQVKRVERMTAAFPAPSASAAQDGLWARTATVSPGLFCARSTLCHGAVVAVPLAGSTTAPVPIKDENLQLYPNVKRALADLASRGGNPGSGNPVSGNPGSGNPVSGNPDCVNAVEMMLANVDSQKFSTGGIIDMVGATHAATFQSVPGKAKSYARIDVEAPGSPASPAPAFFISQSGELAARQATGYWPTQRQRSAAILNKSYIATIPGLPVISPPVPPALPAVNDLTGLVSSIQAAFATAVAAAAEDGIPLDPKMVRVEDSRSNARSAALGVTTDDSGSDGAGWWIDISDPAAVTQLLTTAGGAIVSLPFVGNLYALPGPRWYRPWSPQLVLSNIGRSYKFGFDTRFRTDSKVLTRISGNTLTSMTVSNQVAVFGHDLLTAPESLNVPGLPGEVAALAKETILLDPESAAVMAANAAATQAGGAQGAPALQASYTNAIQGTLLAHDDRFNKALLLAVALDGEQPSPLSVSLWQDPFDPLFLDSSYAHPHSTLEQWKLDPSDVEMTPLSPTASMPAQGPVPTFNERSMVTASVVNVLESALVTRSMFDPRGREIPVQTIDPALNKQIFTRMDVVSAPLTKFDAQLFASDLRLRAGALRINNLELVDIFGLTRPWTSGVAADSPAGNDLWPYWVALPPRFPCWSRFNFRLTSATDPASEASAHARPVCGLLLPDFIEHALEIFDSNGTGLGQLATDIPIQGATAGATLHVTYTPHPWLDPDPDPFHHITNPTLRALVQSVVEQQLVVPAGTVVWAETGLSAMLRTIDTIRGTFDPTAKTAQRGVSLIGEPILVMGARLSFTGTAADGTQELSGDPPLLAAPPDLPTLKVRIGDVTRPDDGVLGLFIQGATPAEGRFAPVTREAADKAIINSLVSFEAAGWAPATHRFVKDQESLVALPANQPVDVVILADVRNSIYATCGALPRKKITVPKEFVEPAVKNLEPSFYTGPILTTTQYGVERTLLPPPDLAGYTAEFLYQAPGATSFASTQVPAAAPLSDLPKSRVLLTEGWVRMVPAKAKS